ncbi:MAG TPA: methionine adenosyltransferase [Candidatus Acetothermia bacterium]|nr:methionine adenosyltransferase [Candidatus Acetothermia bacterium]
MYPRLATSESVAEGHPDKIADRISDAVLDAVLAQDPEGRVACETFVLQGMVLIGGEMATTASIQPERIARRVIREIGYTHPDYGLSHETCAVLNAMRQQSPDIAQAVLRSQERKGGSTDPYDTLGAGDQGIMFGYATTETPEYMPLPITLAHKLAKRLAQVRKDGTLPYLRPDGKTQVTIEYRERKPTRAHTILIAAQHAPEVELERLAEDIRKYVVEPVADGWLDENTEILVNTSGRFVVGGPAADTGMTGRKIIVDTYGGYGSHGGGAFSGKDPTKVDRSGSYMARYVALNIVAAGLAQECEVQIAYAIGRARPLAVNVDCYGTGILPNGILREVVLKVFDFRPAAIIEKLDLRRPIYEPFSCYGHFGRVELDPPWERPDMVEALKREAAKHTRKVV